MQTARRSRIILAGRFLRSAAAQRHVQLVAAIFLLALALRLYGINFGLPGEAHADEPFFVMHALRFGQGDLNPHWFLHPTLYMYILFGFYALYFLFGYLLGVFSSTSDFAVAYFTDPTGFYLLGRSVTAFLGAATVIPLYLLGSRLFSRRAGLIASLFLAVTFLHVEYSHYLATADVPMTFLTTLTLYFAVRLWEEGRTRWYLLAGLAAGLSISTKYSAVLMVVALVSAHLIHTGGGWRGLLPALRAKRLYLGGVAMVVGFLIGTPFALLDFSTFYPSVTGHLEQGRAGWVGLDYTPWVSALTDFLSNGMSVYLLSLALAGLLYGLVVRRTRGDLLVGSFVLVYFLVIGSSQLNFPRYWVILVPPLVLFGSRLLDDLVGRWLGKPGLQGVVLVMAALLLSVAPLSRSLRYDYLMSHKDTAVLAKEWIEANIPPGSRIATTLYGPRLSQTREAIYEERRLRLQEAKSVPQSRSVKRSPSESVETKTLYYEMLLKVSPREPSYYAVRQTAVANQSLEYYLENSFEYLVESASTRNAFLRDRDKYPDVAAFYETLDREFERVQEFWPNKTDRPGAGIIIYKLGEKTNTKPGE